MFMVGNTLAMNVRERAHEYGVMRAIGFGARQLVLLVLAEAAFVWAAGRGDRGGPLLSVVRGGREPRTAGRHELSSGRDPIVRVAWLAVTLGLGLSLLAAVVPVYRVAQLRVADTLRRPG